MQKNQNRNILGNKKGFDSLATLETLNQKHIRKGN